MPLSIARCQPPRHKLQPLAHGAPPRMNHPEHDGQHHGAGDDEESGVDVPAVSFEAGVNLSRAKEQPCSSIRNEPNQYSPWLMLAAAVIWLYSAGVTHVSDPGGPTGRCRPRRGRTRAGSCPGCMQSAGIGGPDWLKPQRPFHGHLLQTMAKVMNHCTNWSLN
jgi:hypothetical protein